MKRILRAMGVVVTGVSLACAGGCVALAVGAAAGAGAYAYHAGKLTATLDGSLDESYEASRAALKSLEFTETSAAKDAFEGRIVAKMADNTDVKVGLEKKGEAATEITIRIGTFGDEAKSTAILADIRKRL
jgi:hypothetical protein